MKPVLYYFKRLQSFSGGILYVNLLGMVLVGFLQGLEIFLIIPLLSVTGIVSMNSAAGPISMISKFLQNFPQLLGLPLILGVYIVLVTGQSLFQKNITLRNVNIHQKFMKHLRMETYRSILHANWDFFIKKRKSDLVNLLTTELGRVNVGLNRFLQLLSSVIFNLIQIGLALWLSVKMTILILVCGFILIALTRRFTKRAKQVGTLTSKLSRSHLASITDQLNGIKEIKSNNLEESRLAWLRSLVEEIQHEQYEYVNINTTSQLIYRTSSAVLIAVFIFLSMRVFDARPEQLLLIVVIFSRLWPQFMSMQSNMEQIAANVPAFKALMELERECEEAGELKDRNQYVGSIQPVHLEQGIECQNVYFRYNQSEPVYALQEVSLQIPAQRMTAIVGGSGAGKSTLIDILMGLMQPESGRVLLDGTPVENDSVLALRRAISYVPQDPFLFNGSIRENLLLFKPEANEEEIWRALEFSVSAEFVKVLPQGLDTIIGDRGIRLSGGERQRLVLARAILRKPSILVLDEATSSLDVENETKIQKVLDRLKGTMTIIIIAHRSSTIKNADQVIVLEQGRVVQTDSITH